MDSPTRRLQEVDSFTPVSSTTDLVGMEQEVQVGQPTPCHRMSCDKHLQCDRAHDPEGREQEGLRVQRMLYIGGWWTSCGL